LAGIAPKTGHLNVITVIAASVGLVGLIILIYTLNATRIAANASKTQAGTAQKQFELSERPWLGIDDVKMV